MKKLIPSKTRFNRVAPLIGTMLFAVAASPAHAAEISLTTTEYTNNFDEMSVEGNAVAPSGWVMTPQGSPNNGYFDFVETQVTKSYDGFNGWTGNTPPTGGGRINWGMSDNQLDRSLGFMSSFVTGGGYPSPTNCLMVGFVNNTGSNIADLNLSFDYERYRIETYAAFVNFYTSTDGSTWTRRSAGDSGTWNTGTRAWYIGPTAVGPITVRNRSFTVPALNIPNGSSFFLKWEFVTGNPASGPGNNSQGIGLDNFSMTAVTGNPLAFRKWQSGSGNWSASANWENSILPVNSNGLVFAGNGGTAVHDIAGLSEIFSLGFSSEATGSYILSGNPLTVFTSITNETVFSQTISNGLTLRPDAALNVLSGDLVLAGTVVGQSNISKIGPGALVLQGSFGLNGGLNVVEGTIRQEASALAAPQAVVNLPSGTVMNLNGFNATIGGLTGNGVVDLGSGANLVVGRDEAGITSFLGGQIMGSGSITKVGSNSLTIGATTYSGPTTNLAGTLRIDQVSTFGDGTGAIVLAGGNITSINAGPAPFPNPVVMTGDTQIEGQSTLVDGLRTFPFASDFVQTLGGTLTVRHNGTASNSTFRVRFQGGGFEFTRPIVLGLPTDAPNTFAQLDSANGINKGPQTYSGVISGPGGFRKASAVAGEEGGVAILSGQNTFSGGTQVSGGYVGLGSDSVVQGATLVSGPAGVGSITINNFANSGLFAHGGARTIANEVVLNGIPNAQIIGTNNLTLAGPFNMGGAAKGLTIVENTTTISGVVRNTGKLTKAGAGTLVLSGANIHSGGTTVQEGTLLINNTSGSGTGTGPVVVETGGTLGGNGIISGGVTVNGSLAANVTLLSGLDMSGGGTFVWQLKNKDTSGAGSNYNHVLITGGNLALGAASKLQLAFASSAAPIAGDPFWQSPRSWKILSLVGAASNPGSTTFSSIENGSSSAGTFSTSVDVDGGIILTFTPGTSQPPQPQINSSIVGAGTASATLSWAAQNGVTYQVQYKDDLNANGWSVLGSVGATGSTASFTDTTGPAPQRFYRIIIP